MTAEVLYFFAFLAPATVSYPRIPKSHLKKKKIIDEVTYLMTEAYFPEETSKLLLKKEEMNEIYPFQSQAMWGHVHHFFYYFQIFNL